MVGYSVNGMVPPMTYTTAIDIEIGDNANDTSCRILKEVAKKHSSLYNFGVKWQGIVVNYLCRLDK